MTTFLWAFAIVCVQLPEARSQTCGAPIVSGPSTERHTDVSASSTSYNLLRDAAQPMSMLTGHRNVSDLRNTNGKPSDTSSLTFMLPSQSADIRNWSGWLMVIIAWTPVEWPPCAADSAACAHGGACLLRLKYKPCRVLTGQQATPWFSRILTTTGVLDSLGCRYRAKPR